MNMSGGNTSSARGGGNSSHSTDSSTGHSASTAGHSTLGSFKSLSRHQGGSNVSSGSNVNSRFNRTGPSRFHPHPHHHQHQHQHQHQNQGSGQSQDHHPQRYDPSTTTTASALDYEPKLTATGYENEMKKAILECFNPNLPFPAKYEGMVQFEEVWEEDLLPPISLSPLTPQEVFAINTGQFMASASSTASHGRGGARGGGTSIPRRGGRGAGRGGRGGVSTTATGNFVSHSLERPMSIEGDGGALVGSLPSFAATGHDFRDLEPISSKEDDEEILWSMPTGGDPSLGTFDEKGNFTMVSPHLVRRNEPVSSAAAATIPGHDRLPPPSSLVSGDSATATATTTTTTPIVRWLYRDPAGQIQGPFSTEKMLNWYNRKYFPENLPLRREQDIIFEPLSAWKLKLGGKNPFEVELEKQGKLFAAVTPTLASSADPAIISSPSGSKSTHSSPEIAPTTTTSHTAAIFAKLGIPWGGANAEASSATQASSATSSSAATKVQPLAQEELSFIQQLGSRQSKTQTSSMAKSSLISTTTTTTTTIQSEQAIPILDPMANLRINNSTVAPRTMTSPQQQSITTAKSLVSPLDVKPAPPPVVGWAKPATSVQPKSLDEIIREEDERAAVERERNHKVSSGSGQAPKSFAETLRGAMNAISPSPPNAEGSITMPLVSPKHPHTTASTSSKSPIFTPPTASMAESLKKKDVNVKSPSSTILPSSLSSTPESLKSWCLSQLKPLEASYDVQMCTILLMEFRTPTEVISFVDDNLKSNYNVDLKAFTNEFIRRRFGGAIEPTTSKSINATSPSTQKEPIQGEMEGEFVTVGKKSHRAGRK